jgi:pheromone shutdown protein TraB
MITIIGTGHVFNLAQGIIHILDEKQPNIVCVELDKQRFQTLIFRKENPKEYERRRKNAPMIYNLLATFQDSMAKKYGVQAGDEMMTAINYAKSHQIPVAFIDMDAQKLFNKMLKKMGFIEKIKLMLSGITGFFVSKKLVEKEIEHFEDDFDKYIDQVGEKFPTIKKVLIDDRNKYMINKLLKADEEFEQTVAVVGDGHIPGLSSLLEEKNIDFETIRLKELRNNIKTLEKNDKSSASFSLEYKTPE